RVPCPRRGSRAGSASPAGSTTRPDSTRHPARPAEPMPALRTPLRARLLRLFGTRDASLDDAGFDALAREVFAFQLEHNRPYAAYCRRRGIDATNLEHWSDIPAAPTAAFREIALVAGDPTSCDAVFRTSGTTHGGRRGTHYVPDIALYDASLLAGF